MAEAERDWNEFFKKVIKDIDEDDILGNAEARLKDFMSYYPIFHLISNPMIFYQTIL